MHCVGVVFVKAGEMSRALELCFQLKQYDVLHQIADDLTEATNPAMITRVHKRIDRPIIPLGSHNIQKIMV